MESVRRLSVQYLPTGHVGEIFLNQSRAKLFSSHTEKFDFIPTSIYFCAVLLLSRWFHFCNITRFACIRRFIKHPNLSILCACLDIVFCT